MKIALPKDGIMLNQHFGRSESFAIVTIDEKDIIGLKEVSTADLQHNHGGLSQMLLNQSVELVIAGGMGEGAYNALQEKGIKVIRGAAGSIKDVLQQYLDGSLKDTGSSCKHHGEHGHHHE